MLGNNPQILHWRERIADWRGRGIYQGWPNRHRAIFIHIPKTAGSSVARSLFGEPRGNPHAPYHEYERINRRKFREYFKFTFVRNPWDRAVSSYFYLRNTAMQGAEEDWRRRHVVPYADFASFVRESLDQDSIWKSLHFRPQHSFICDATMRLRADFVGRMETIDRDFDYVCGRLGVSAKLERTNRSDHRSYTEYYTDELRERVAAVYADDIALFGYRFDAPPVRPLLSVERA